MNRLERNQWHDMEMNERETIIYLNLKPGHVILYTNDWRMANRLIKQGLEPDRIYRAMASHGICGMDFVADNQDRQSLRKILSPTILVPRKYESPYEKDS